MTYYISVLCSKTSAKPNADDENLLPIPEKLLAMGYEDVDPKQIDPEAMEDMLKQLYQMAEEFSKGK